MEMKEISARSLRPGMWFLGRGEWHVKAEKVRFNSVGGNTIVEGVNRFGENVKHRYRFGDKVMAWEE